MPRMLLRGTGGRDWAPSRCSPGTRQRHFAGTKLEPRELLDYPQGVRTPRSGSPTRRVHIYPGDPLRHLHMRASAGERPAKGAGRCVSLRPCYQSPRSFWYQGDCATQDHALVNKCMVLNAQTVEFVRVSSLLLDH